MPESRRQRRIVYHTKVRVRAPGREHSVVARVQNLSSRGIFITASELPDAGTEVQCRMTIAGERRTFRGRVAWVRHASAHSPLRSPGAGIEFLNLERQDAEMLSRLVEPSDDDKQPVDVWFEGMKAPIRCHAVVLGEGLRLSTRLPFMRLNSAVRVSFNQRGTDQIRLGTLDAVTLEPSNDDGVPHLQLNVTTATPDTAQGTIDVAPEHESPRGRTPPEGMLVADAPSTLVDVTVVSPPPAAPAAVAPAPVIVPAPEVSDRDRTQRIAMPNRPTAAIAPAPKAPPMVFAAPPARLVGWPAVLGGFVAGALVVGIGSALFRSPPRAPPPASAAVAHAPTIQPLAAAAATPPPTPSEAPAPPVAAVNIEPLPPASAEAARSEAALTASGFAVSSDAGTTILEVPLLGNAKGAHIYPLADPVGLAVNLPRARPRANPGVHRPAEGFRQVLVLRKGSGSHVRFLYDPRTHDGEILVGEDALKLVLKVR